MPASAENNYKWTFDEWNNREGWTVPEPLTGSVMGGSLWLTIRWEAPEKKIPDLHHQIWGPNIFHEINSPKGLNLPAAEYQKVRMRILNLSAETDGHVFWRTTETPDADAGLVRFTMKPDCHEWQEVICHMDSVWQGTIDQIRIRPGTLWMRGDIWIDTIEIVPGPPREKPFRPDVCSEKVVPKISYPGVTQEQFADAFKVLDECLVTDVPANGFNHPFMSPGGIYGPNWWQLDTSLNCCGAQWANFSFAEGVMRGFRQLQLQNPDGRIDLYGGSPIRGQRGDISSIPRIFEAGYDIARRTQDREMQELIYAMFKDYLCYWYAPYKRDAETGLITAIFEETFCEPLSTPRTVAAVDLNAAVALGCHNTSQLAKYLGYEKEATAYAEDFEELKAAINQYMWNKEDGAYYNYNVKEKQQRPRLICTIFDPMRLGIASPEQSSRLVEKLTDPEIFNWGNRPMTSLAMTEPDYVEATGPYDGRAWFGDIWTMRNLPVIFGLRDTGHHELASELSWWTIEAFNDNYCEYVVPTTRSGEGVQRYGWSASQYIQTMVEHIFGVDVDLIEGRLRIFPHLPQRLYGQIISLKDLQIPGGKDCQLDLTVEKSAAGNMEVKADFSGKPPEAALEIIMAREGDEGIEASMSKGRRLKVEAIEDLTNAVGIRWRRVESISVRFESQ